MWFDANGCAADWSEGARHLARVDPVLRRVIRKVGPPNLSPRKDYFVALCKAIFSQQLSTKVAAALFSRFCDLFPRGRPTPLAVIEALKDAQIAKSVGLSRNKAIYLCDLASHFADARIPTRRLARMSDDQIIESLVAVNGIGRWTAEMFLIFVLNRPDVLPVDDLGLREGVRELYEMSSRPTPAQVLEMGERWKPYRTLATWYIWRRGTSSSAPPVTALARKRGRANRNAQQARQTA